MLALFFGLVVVFANPLEDALQIDILALSSVGITTDFDQYTPSAARGATPVIQHFAIDRPEFGQNLTGHLLILKNPVGDSGLHFSFFPSLKGCPGRTRTSDTADAHSCRGAMNAAFFDMKTGACIGNLIADGKLVQLGVSQWINFGVLRNGTLVAGYLNERDIREGDFATLATGHCWLVRQGRSFVDKAASIEGVSSSFIKLLAPRVAVGWNKDGEILLLEVDGYAPPKNGLDLHQFAQLALELGFVSAVNMDGGGSSTVYYKGNVVNRCTDGCASGHEAEHCPLTPGKCQRTVTSIACYR